VGTGVSSADRRPDCAQEPKREFLLQFKNIARVFTLKAAITEIAAVNEDAAWNPPTLIMLKSVSDTLERKDPEEPIKHKLLSSNHTPLGLLPSTTTPIDDKGAQSTPITTPATGEGKGSSLAAANLASTGTKTAALDPLTSTQTPLGTQTPVGEQAPLGAQVSSETPLGLLSSMAAAFDPLSSKAIPLGKRSHSYAG
jgi:hypothetical protein